MGGLGALPLDEATYLRSGGEKGVPFDGRRKWRMHFPPGGDLPCDAFWSLSMYEPTPLGEFFFVRNELDRFAIGDRSPGLRRNADGSLDIWIGADNPGPDRGANWLPAPPGPFHLFPCAYLPRIDQLEGRMPVPHPGTYDD
ncbi:MAG: DUF1214 domain-containing protein [Antarcticimicrobium sp.]|uniref:DUF1214 domain-containing protein n=1 Tax=Antarcticimicrobium sp. TaxID=2824147 RepID=UPI00262CAF8A|nr:DUF1214 domain-containing protein [Antarcticimicrobium sp.]MDF1717546.1 DUF1214 domain-containing protein [Antarcticimicrobium sp.]